jgi:hypothetical protein
VKRERAKEDRPIRLKPLLCFWLTSVPLLRAQRTTPASSAPSSVEVEAFVDTTQPLGVDFQYRASHASRACLLETMRAGVALFAYDNGGRLDIYLVNGAPLGNPTPRGATPQKTDSQYWNRLYHQKADGTFEDFSHTSEVALDMDGRTYAGVGVDFADYNKTRGLTSWQPTWQINATPSTRKTAMAPSATPATPQELTR